MQRNGAAGLEHSILHACLKDLRYDRMFEHVRSPYLYDLLRAIGNPGDYLAPILNALAGNDEDNAYQLCGLAFHFALWRWGKYASPEELELAANALLVETDV